MNTIHYVIHRIDQPVSYKAPIIAKLFDVTQKYDCQYLPLNFRFCCWRNSNNECNKLIAWCARHHSIMLSKIPFLVWKQPKICTLFHLIHIDTCSTVTEQKNDEYRVMSFQMVHMKTIKKQFSVFNGELAILQNAGFEVVVHLSQNWRRLLPLIHNPFISTLTKN